MDLIGNLVLILEVDVADFRRDGEARRHRQVGLAHFGQPGALAAERFFHGSVTVGPTWAELIYMLFHMLLLYEFVTISEKSAKSCSMVSKLCSMARRLLRTLASGAFTITLSK